MIDPYFYLHEKIHYLQEDLDIWKRIAIEYIRSFLSLDSGQIPTTEKIERELDFAWQDAIKYSDYGQLEKSNVLGSTTNND